MKSLNSVLTSSILINSLDRLYANQSCIVIGQVSYPNFQPFPNGMNAIVLIHLTSDSQSYGIPLINLHDHQFCSKPLQFFS